MSWLSDIEEDYREGIYPTSGAIRMARVIRALVMFIKLNIDFDAPLRPVGLSNLPPDAKELIIKIEE